MALDQPHEDYYQDDEWHGQVAVEFFMMGMAEQDVCPKCLGDLDSGWECTKCDYDASWLME